MIPESLRPVAYAVFRIVFGLMFLSHGLQKLFGMFGGIDTRGGTVPLAGLAGIAGCLEIPLGCLILIGLWVRLAAFLASGEMAVAYFLGHQAQGFWPLENGGEPAVLFCFGFLSIAAQGAGIWSVDQGIRKKAPLPGQV